MEQAAYTKMERFLFMVLFMIVRILINRNYRFY